MQAIILCGGEATRLEDIAENIPKILLEIGGQTILDWELDLLQEAGADEVILASGYLHDVLYDTVGENHRGLPIRYAREEDLLGTGGAIKNAMQYVSTSPFFVLNGDVLMKDFSLSRMLARLQPQMDGLILGVLVEDINEYGEIVSDERGRITAFLEKQALHRSGYVNIGMYLFNQSIANYFPDEDVFSVERHVFPNVPNLYVFRERINWVDIGTPDRLAYARQNFSL